MTSRSWVFTVNNFSFVPQALPKNGRYCIIAQEHTETSPLSSTNSNSNEGSSSNIPTPHLQGYIELTRSCRMSFIQKWLQVKAHCERRRGTRLEARDYCKKGDQTHEEWVRHHQQGPNFGLNAIFEELGTWKEGGQGTRTDIDELFKDAKKLKPLKEIAKHHKGTYMRYYKSVQHIQHLYSKPGMRPELKISVYWGIPDSGKTYAAWQEDPDLYAVPLGKGFWFDNYEGEKTLLIDDFCGEYRLVDLLRLLDVYPIQLPVKFGYTWLRATRIIITTNTALEYWYDYTSRQDSLLALQRRIHDSVYYGTKYVSPPSTPPTPSPYTPPSPMTEEYDDVDDAHLAIALSAQETLSEEENPHHPYLDPFSRVIPGSSSPPITSLFDKEYNDPCPGEKGKK